MHLKACFSLKRPFCKTRCQPRYQPCPRQRRPPSGSAGTPGPARGQCAGAAAVAAWGTRWRSRGGTPRPGRAALQPTECFLSQPEEKQESTVKAKRRKKKKISDVLQKSAPKPGVPADLQNLLTQHFGENRSVIEIEELQLSDSCFLTANDLTHSFSSYLKEICPKWAKLRRSHKEKKSVVMLVLCSSALRCLELIKSMTAFKGDCRVLKLFAKHIKIQEQINMLEKGVFHIGVGTPGRVKALVEQDALCLNSTKYMILDWNWRDQKLRRMMDIPEIKKETIDLLEKSIIKLCRDGSVKLGLF
ncbi:protein CMSS1 isoform X2 [Poecile atricapillus]|uniref:protein CMSS1 isoform X2 n=1 Tax=Poecile atricapillus TaxID=48891 RepID=UPI002738CF67|nr:protein CMSS1 isoform X2 [Poecile atricapillus]